MIPTIYTNTVKVLSHCKQLLSHASIVCAVNTTADKRQRLYDASTFFFILQSQFVRDHGNPGNDKNGNSTGANVAPISQINEENQQTKLIIQSKGTEHMADCFLWLQHTLYEPHSAQ